MAFYNKYPYTDFHELNLDWILNKIKSFDETISDFTAFNKITWGGTWTASKSYTTWTIVQDSDGNGYIAVQAVPTNVPLTNNDYWAPVANYNVLFTAYEERIAKLEQIQNSVTVTYVSGNLLGTCVILSRDNEAFIIDFGVDTTASRLLSTLYNLGIKSIIGFALSHYHNDHVNGLPALLSATDFDFTNCVAYLPHGAVSWSSGTWTADYSTLQTTIIQDINAKGCTIVYPTENQTATIFDNCTLKFNNLSSTYFTNYYTITDNGYTIYNNFSMCITVSMGTHRIWLPADIQEAAEENMAGLIPGIDLFTIEHHGLTLSINDKYASAISSTVFVNTAYGSTWEYIPHRVQGAIMGIAFARGTVYGTNDGNLTFTLSELGISANIGNTIEHSYFPQILTPGQNLTSGDFDDLTDPGMYTVQNVTYMNAIDNSPPGFTSGGKVEIVAGTKPGAKLQKVYAMNSSISQVSLRQIDSDGYIYRWKHIFPSTYANIDITSDMYSQAITIQTNTNNLTIKNGLATLKIGISFDAQLAAGTDFLTITGIDFIRSSTANNAWITLVGLHSGTFYNCKINANATGFTIHNYEAIPANTEVEGVCTWQLEVYD